MAHGVYVLYVYVVCSGGAWNRRMLVIMAYYMYVGCTMEQGHTCINGTYLGGLGVVF